MKKFLLISGAALLVLVIVAYLVATFFLGSIVKAGVNNYGPRITGTAVVLQDADISPLSGGGTLKGFSVANPEGWTQGDAFSLNEVRVKMRPSSLLGSHVIVEEVFIDQPVFRYETKLVRSNIGDLLKNIEAAVGSSDEQAQTEQGEPMKFEVKHFRLQGGKVTVGVGNNAVTLPMPPIELRDLGTKEGGITSSQLAMAIMRSITSSVITATTEAAGKIGGTMGAAAGDAAKKASEGLKKLLPGGK